MTKTTEVAMLTEGLEWAQNQLGDTLETIEAQQQLLRDAAMLLRAAVLTDPYMRDRQADWLGRYDAGMF